MLQLAGSAVTQVTRFATGVNTGMPTVSQPGTGPEVTLDEAGSHVALPRQRMAANTEIVNH